MAFLLVELSYVLLYVYMNNSVLMMYKTLEFTKPLPRNQLSASAIRDSLALKRHLAQSAELGRIMVAW